MMIQKINIFDLMENEFVGNNKRWEWDDLFAMICKSISYRSSCAKTRQAALLIKDQRIISFGVNGPRSGSINCIYDGGELACGKDSNGSCYEGIHAEQNCLGYSCRNGLSSDGCTMWVTQTPCISCAKLVVAAGIKEYVYLSEYRISDGINFLENSGLIVRKYNYKGI